MAVWLNSFMLSGVMYHCGLLLVLLDLSLDVVGSVSQLEIDRHLELGREFLAKGQLQDALSHYHAAVGKAKFALLDLDRVLELKPDFTSARLQRGNVLLKQAQFEKAEVDFRDVLAVEPHNSDAYNALYKIVPAQKDLLIVDRLIKNGDYTTAAQQLSRVIEVCPWSAELRERRAECYEALEDYVSAISDIRSTTKLQSDNTQGYLKTATLHYRLGQVEESLTEIRECLKLDPEHSQCFSFYKKVKKIAKLLTDARTYRDQRDYAKCIDSAQPILKHEPQVANVRFLAHQELCKCYVGNLEPSKAIKNCHEAIKIRKEAEVFCDRGEAYLAAEMFDDAIKDFEEALEIDMRLQRAKQGLHKAQQRQKLSESRDYYKILGVPRTASKRDIIKAYRKAAQKWHPDNFQEGDEKKRAEKKFIDIAAAKEVLTDDEKRAKFDQGEDPLDPESGKHQGFNPFQEFHQFHGSPFQFKFHFN
ncbi:DnaJ like protein subfamily C member 3 [Eufriesea mexicana]|uniref:DnaJ like protein subfamily C member 3 n=1 Tax=Eufriesea mexicana TaxID=516756 RepID=A0A310SLP9_9HYME|nr:DnaJ like protein subfamily C member 3 [Eufriesea mexicana]